MRCIGRMCRRWMKTNWRRVRRRCPSRLRRCRGSPGRCPQGVLLAVFILLWFDLSGSDAREVSQFSTRERRVAGLRGGRRPARATRWVARTPPPAPPYFGFGLRRPARASEMPRRKPGGSTNRTTRSQFKRSKPTGFGVEAGSKRHCASLRGRRLRPARLYEPQELGSKNQSKPRPKVQPNSSSFGLRILRVD